MIKITLIFIIFFLLIWFVVELLKHFKDSKLFYTIFIKIIGLLLLTFLSLIGIVVLF